MTQWLYPNFVDWAFQAKGQVATECPRFAGQIYTCRICFEYDLRERSGVLSWNITGWYRLDENGETGHVVAYPARCCDRTHVSRQMHVIYVAETCPR